MNIPFFRRKKTEQRFESPKHTAIPQLQHAFLAALYDGVRKGGDFYDVLQVPGTDRVLFLLLDVAGKRESAMHIAAHVQGIFRQYAPIDFAAPDVNEAEALSSLLLGVNRAIIDCCGSSHFSPAFMGCYNQELGILCYINAGHTPAIVRDSTGLALLEANGLPLGLFSHVTHDAQMLALERGAAVVLVSRGLIECKRKSEEYGIARAQSSIAAAAFTNAEELCAAVLSGAREFIGDTRADNDLTTMALVRASAAQSAMLGH